MIEAKYFKDYNHNYLILKCGNTEDGEHYRYHMLASNKIERILKCSVRNVNGEVYFYYDISSKVTLENYYHGRQMSYEQVRDFFVQLDGIYQSIGQFFMEESGLLLYPESIYYDFSSGKYYGLYYPEENAENPYEQLMDFLINHIDTKNQKLVDAVYRIYEMSGEQFFSWAHAVRLFDEDKESISENTFKNTSGADVIMEAGSAALAVSAGMGERNEPDEDSTEECCVYHNENSRAAAGKAEAGKAEKGMLFYHVFAILTLCGIAGILWIYLNYELSPKEMMIVVCCMGVLGLCFVFSLIQVLLSGRKNKVKEERERELLRDIEDEFRDERTVPLQDVLDKNMDMAVAAAGGFAVRRTHTAGTRHAQAFDARRTPGCGETVFIDTRKQSMEYKLYALDKKNKKHIELTQFPFTIGKMAGCVDCALTDDSISRLHARIEKQDGKILLTDMNSMNGTYKNGLRMEPSETVEIEPGDEIRFGKLNYCYR